MAIQEKSIQTTGAEAPAEWGNGDEIGAVARRIKTVLPGGSKMSDGAVLALAQYAHAMGANPFRGEIYAWNERGRVVLSEGYKLLVRWARRQCNFSDSYTPLHELPAGAAIGYTCRILRQDAIPTFTALTQGGIPAQEALELASQSAVGVVMQAELTTKDGRSNQPPKGWTWDQVARKRALKNALNLAYGMPSMQEIAQESWVVDDTQTLAEDWEGIALGTSPEAAAREAAYNAQQRERLESGPTVTAEQARDDLFDDQDDWSPSPSPPPPPESPQEPATQTWSADLITDEIELTPPPNSTATRPLDPSKLREFLHRKTGDDPTPATEAQVPFVARKFQEAFAPAEDSRKRYHLSLNWLFGVDSAKKLAKKQAGALLDWLLHPDGQDETGDTPLHPAASDEANRVYREALKAQGQQEMALPETE